MTNYDVSIYDARNEISFDLKSSASLVYPTFRSIETIFGRKCFQFKWTSGSKYFCVGFSSNGYNVFIDVSTSFSKIRIQEPNVSESFYNINSLFIANRNYLFCIDTRENKFIFVNESQFWSYKYSKNAPKMNLYVQEHISSHDSFVVKMRGPFDVELPSSFFTMSDHRLFEFVSCSHKRKHFSLLSLVFISIIS